MYLTFAIIGGILLVITIFTGGEELDLDVGDPDFDIASAEVGSEAPSVVSLKTISTFLLAFGLGAMVAIHTDKSIVVQLLAGFSSGIVTGFLYYLVMRLMYGQQGSSMIQESIIGKVGMIEIPSSSPGGLSQMKINVQGSSQEYMCKSNEDLMLKKGSLVEVLDVIGNVYLVKEKK